MWKYFSRITRDVCAPKRGGGKNGLNRNESNDLLFTSNIRAVRKTGQTFSCLLPGDGKMVLLTGPNACGKSIYLKQVGLIAYLAHLGSYVPAVSAELPLLNSIFSRIQVQ